MSDRHAPHGSATPGQATHGSSAQAGPADGSNGTGRPGTTRRNAFLLVGLIVALVLAGVVSGFASGDPDGLERVAEDQGFAETAEEHALAEGPLADYTVRGVQDERLSTGLAGVLGVGITFAFGLGLFALVRRGRRAEDVRPEDGTVPEP